MLAKIREEWGSEDEFDTFVRAELPGVLLAGKKAWASRTRCLFVAALANLLYMVFEVVASTVNGGGIGCLQNQRGAPDEQVRLSPPANCAPESSLMRWWDPASHGRAVLTVFDDAAHARNLPFLPPSRLGILFSTLIIEGAMGVVISVGYLLQQGKFGSPPGYGESLVLQNVAWSFGTVNNHACCCCTCATVNSSPLLRSCLMHSC